MNATESYSPLFGVVVFYGRIFYLLNRKNNAGWSCFDSLPNGSDP